MIASQEQPSMHDIGSLFQGVTAEVIRLVGKEKLQPHEMAAVGFVLEKTIASRPEEDSIDSAVVARELFGIGLTDSAPAAAWKVHEKVNLLLLEEIRRRRDKGESNESLARVEEQTAFMHNQAAAEYAGGKTCVLGTAPLEWLSSPLQLRVQLAMSA